ncbi:MAG: hypothetical protein V7L04_32360 [Nostoc sp.]
MSALPPMEAVRLCTAMIAGSDRMHQGDRFAYSIGSSLPIASDHS